MRLPEVLLTFALSVVLSSACGSSPTTTSPPCEPSCRDGYVCSRGSCVSACNPTCRSNEVCVPSGSSFTCATLPTDSATPTDATAAEDTQSMTDTPAPADRYQDPDTVAPMDNPPGDVVAPPTDRPTMSDIVVGDSGRIPCGNAGQGCCFMRACEAGNECVMNVCRAFTRGMGECGRSADCMAGQVCGNATEWLQRGCEQGASACTGPSTIMCGSATECFRHGGWSCAMPNGMGALGAACTNGSQCATNVCLYGHCTVPCTVGAAGDSDCRAAGPNLVCTELTFSAMLGASRVTLGTCTHSCARNADCTSPELCVPLLNFLNDRYDFICAALQPGSVRTGTAGTPCTDGNTCQSALCLPPPRATGPGTCTAFCVTDADCTMAAPMCGTLLLLRPSGSIQMSRGCMPRE